MAKKATWDDGHNSKVTYSKEFNKIAEIKKLIKSNALSKALRELIALEKFQLAKELLLKIKDIKDIIPSVPVTIEKGNLELLKLFFERGLDKKIRLSGDNNFKEHTLLTKAAARAQLDIVKHLVEIQKVNITDEILSIQYGRVTAYDLKDILSEDENRPVTRTALRNVNTYLKPFYEKKRIALTRPLLKLIENLDTPAP